MAVPGLSNAIDFGYGTLAGKLQDSRALNLADLAYRMVRGIGTPGSFSPVNPPGVRDVLSAAKARKDPLLNVNWYIDLPIIDGKKLSWEYIEEATLPYMSVEQSSVYRAGKMYHYAGHYSLDTLSLKCYEDSYGIVNAYANAWRQKIIDPVTGQYGYAKSNDGYKKNIAITVLDVTQSMVFKMTYLGCFPMRQDALSLGSTVERVVPNLEFSVDDVQIVVGKYAPDAIPSIIDNLSSNFPANLGNLPNLPNIFTNFANMQIPSLTV